MNFLAQSVIIMLNPLSSRQMGADRPLGTRARSTLRDVARIAGVSTTTASLVLAHKGSSLRISEDTHKRVTEAALRLGYAPNLLQQSLRKGRTNILSFFNCYRNRVWGDLYMDGLSSGIENAAGSLGYNILSHCTFESSPEETYRLLNGGLSDGLILFAPNIDEPLLPMLRQSGLPTVMIHPRGEEKELSTVREDPRVGTALIADQLALHGHRKAAAVVTVVDGVRDPLRRVHFLRESLQRYGAEVPEEWVVTFEGNPHQTALQVRCLSPQPTAVFVWHDRVAYALVEAFEQQGLEIPDDISVVGYDGLLWPSTTKHVVASTKVALDELAQKAVSTLDRLLKGEPGPIASTIPVSFLPGSTLGKVS